MTKISDIQVRTLKVYKHHLTKYYRNDYIAPYIRLCGKWLEDAGFKTGNKISIIVAKNLIIIRQGQNTEPNP